MTATTAGGAHPDHPVDRTVALIGVGVMGEAVLRSVIDAVGAERVRITDGRADHGEAVAQRYRVRWAPDAGAAATDADVVLLAVKPKDVAAVAAVVAPVLRPDALVISVAAGITAAFLEEHFGAHLAVVRVMPNTPALIGRGIAAASPGAHADEGHLDVVEALLAGTGTTVRLPEDQQDAVTAVSGSGPAYLFYLLEAMRDAGVAQGLAPQVALQLARETAAGAAELARSCEEDPSVLRERVTSPGGTTLAATTELDARDVKGAIGAAIARAAQRAAELGRG